MPFSQTEMHPKAYWARHFNEFLKPLIKECGDLKVSRSKALRGDLVREIVENLYDSDIVVADLTGWNPNVFWELGVRLSYKHGTITIAEEGTELPFNISTKGTLYYHPRNHIKLEEFRTQFKMAIRDCLDNPDKPDSRVLEILQSRLTRHLAPPINFNILPVYYENNQPRAVFVIANLGPLPAQAKITVRAFLGKKDIGLIQDAKGYYSGQTKWNLDAGFVFRGNFALKKEAIESKATLILEVRATVFDIHGHPHEKSPLCFTYVKDKNIWYTEPTSFSEIERFIK